MTIKTDVAIVGGGTAGWLAALYAKHYYPNFEITVVASEEIGILGAGEGTTPPFIEALEQLKIPVQDIITKCKGTLKVGIEFKNWHGDGSSFFHNFSYSTPSNSELCPGSLRKEELAYAVTQKRKLWELSPYTQIATESKTPFVFDTPTQLSNKGWYALHFDAALLAKYLKETALERGITFIDAILEDVFLSKEEHISELCLSTGQSIAPKFVFDCSGFRRLIIGNKLKAEWVSYTDLLKTNKALPFFVPHNNDTRPVTTAIAMKHGWVWQIPVQDRYGCGYVFDGTKITVEEAKEEVEAYFGITIACPKTFDYSPGGYKTPLVNNCLAVGLAHSFVEPMEATSIMCTTGMLDYFLQNDGLNCNLTLFKNEFNERVARWTDEFRDFIALHYKTGRKDTLFWKEVSSIPIPVVDRYIEAANYNVAYRLPVVIFDVHSWVLFLDELGHLNANDVANQVPEEDFTTLSHWLVDRKHKISDITKHCIPHKQFIALHGGGHSA